MADLRAAQPQLPIERVVAIGLELSDALSRAHHLRILHRDIKPANILLAEDGTPRLTDFGLARIGRLPRLTGADSIRRFFYMSPEAVENREVNERSDIWSFGIVLYEMLTGSLPFTGESSFEVVWAIKNQTLPFFENLRSGIPPTLGNLIRRMLRKDNAARVESTRQLGVELETLQKDLGVPAAPSESEKNGANNHPGPHPMIRVLIVDDHAVVRHGLRMFIDLQEDMEVIGEGANGDEAIQMAGSLILYCWIW